MRAGVDREMHHTMEVLATVLVALPMVAGAKPTRDPGQSLCASIEGLVSSTIIMEEM